MAYMKKEIRILVDKMHYNFRVPKKWNDFIEKEEEKHNLILKYSKAYKCTCCNQEFMSSKKINEYEKCPNCHNTYLIKQARLKKYKLEKNLLLLDKIDNELIIRIFKLDSYYSEHSRSFSNTVSEFARIIVNKKVLLYNENVFINTGGYICIRHYLKDEKWRVYDGYHAISGIGKVYPYNLKELFNNTNFQYSKLWILAEKSEELDLEFMINRGMYCRSLEFLIKMELYKLAQCPQTFDKLGNFEDRFGVPKDYYPFMKKYDIDINELKVLNLIKEKDIKIIRKLTIYNIEELEKISKYFNPKRILKYKLNKYNLSIYIDYLKFLNELGYDMKNKKYLFPKDINYAHDKLEKQVKIKNKKEIKENIKIRYMQLKKFTYVDKKFIITPASSIESLENESKQLNNCVRTYAEDYANGNCNIFFMRLMDNQDKSLVTVETIGNEVVQARIKNNQQPNKEQLKFLKEWENKILRKKECINGRNIKKNAC